MSDFNLGDRVNITGTAEKYRDRKNQTRYKESGLPFRYAYPDNITYDTGVIVGKRTVIEGGTDYDEYGASFRPEPGSAQTVWLVAFSLHMKPTMCFTHQVQHQIVDAGDSNG